MTETVTTVSEGYGFLRKIGAADVLDTIANLSNDEVFTPPKLANQVLDLLPAHVWSDPTLKFLDPCVKTGIFLREIVKRLMAGLAKQIPDEKERREHILRNQVYGIAITELTALMSRRTVYCASDATREKNDAFPENCFSAVKFDTPEGNIAFLHATHDWPHEKNGKVKETAKCRVCGASWKDFGGEGREGMESYAYPFIHMDIQEIFGDMQFDVIIGNPPYQLKDGGGKNGVAASPVYHNFVTQAKELNPRYVSMIIPSRWFTGGKGLDRFRDSMVNDRSIRNIIDFPKLFDCFPGVEIKGGVCIFLMDRNYDGDCIFEKRVDNETIEKVSRDLREGTDVILRDAISTSILRRTAGVKNHFCEIVQPRKPFGIESTLRGSDTQFPGSLKMYRQGGFDFVGRGAVHKGDSLIGKWKVMISKAADGHGRIPMQVTGIPFVAEPGSVCSETYLVVAGFDNFDQANNAAQFMRTKFCRYFVSLRKISQNMISESYSFVPLLDFNESWTDDKLYSQFNLASDEISFIESTIKEMP